MNAYPYPLRFVLRFVLLGLLVAGASSGCGIEEIVVTTDTTRSVPCGLDRLVISAEGAMDPLEVDLASSTVLPASVSLVNRGSRQTIRVVVTGYLRGQRRMRAYADGEFKGGAQWLNMVLDEECTVPAGESAPEANDGCDRTSTQAAWDGPPEVLEKPFCDPVSAYSFAEESFVPYDDACVFPADVNVSILQNADEEEVQAPAEILAVLEDFDFSYYGNPVTNIWVGDNGYLSFGDSAPNSTREFGVNPGPLADPGSPRPGVVAFWDDLVTRDNGVCMAVEGAMGTRRLWTTWSHACFGPPCAAIDDVNISVILEEGTGRILVLYGDMVSEAGGRAEGFNATVGVTDSNLRSCTCNDVGVCADGPDEGLPCGFTQVFSRMVIEGGVKSTVFTPIPG